MCAASSDDLWNYEVGDDQVLSDSEEETTQKRKAGEYNAAALLPAEKQAKMRRLYGNGATGDGLEDAVPAGRRAPLADSGSDSDLELIEEVAAKKALQEGKESGGVDAAAAGAGTRSALDSKSESLLAKSKALLSNLKRGQQAWEEEEEDEEPDPSPAPARRKAAASPAAAASAEDLPDSALRKSAKGKRILLRLEASHNRVLAVRTGKQGSLLKVFEAFRQQALKAGWIGSADARLRFVFDGEQLDPSATPDSLDMEDGDKIEVHT